MKYLGFTNASANAHGQRIAQARLVERSCLPISAACVVASAVRETLGALLGYPVEVRLFEPLLPTPQAWRAIECDANLYRVSGRITDAALVIRPRDAARLASAAFGERANDARPLSSIERSVLERAVRALAENLVSVCGQRDAATASKPLRDLSGFVTYFELALALPVECCIGIALARDPQGEPCGTLRLDDLLDLQVEIAGSLELPAITPKTLLELEIGAIVPMTTTTRPPTGTLSLGRQPIGRGEWGVSANRYAIALGS